MHKKFASLAHSKEHAYAFDSDAYDSKAPMDAHFRMFQTYGDGLIQHSTDWPVTAEFLGDFLASFAVAMMEDEELLDRAKYSLADRPSDQAIEFAATVVWKENPKTRYFSAQEMRISSNPNKRHDKRYQELRDFHDGSPNSIFRVLIPEYAHGMEAYCYATAIRDWLLKSGDRPYMELPGEFLRWSKDRESAIQLRNGYESCWCLIQSHQLRHLANSNLESYKRTLPQPVDKPVEKSDAA